MTAARTLTRASVLALGLLLSFAAAHSAPAGTLLSIDREHKLAISTLRNDYYNSQTALKGEKGASTFTDVEDAFIGLMNLASKDSVISKRFLYASTDADHAARIYSGRLYLPERHGPVLDPTLPLVIYMHGTETGDQFAPSNDTGDETFLGALGAGLFNMAVAMPDGPGMGADPALKLTPPKHHPYMHADSLAPSIIDAIRALKDSKQVFDGTNYKWDGNLYLMGYSEGGFIIMAALKALAVDPEYSRLGIDITAAAAMAGPFDFYKSTLQILGDPTTPLARPYIQGDLLVSWAGLFPKDFPLLQAANPKLMNKDGTCVLSTWLNGTLRGAEITPLMQDRLNGGQPVVATDVVNGAWARQCLAPSSGSGASQRLVENTLVGGWAPDYPVLLAQDPKDEIISYANTTAIYESWKAMAARNPRLPTPMAPRQLTVFGKDPGHTWGGLIAIPDAFFLFKRRTEQLFYSKDANQTKAVLTREFMDAYQTVNDLHTPLEELVKRPGIKLPSLHLPSAPKKPSWLHL